MKFDKPATETQYMAGGMSAALLFWLPLAMIPFGGWAFLSRKKGIIPILGVLTTILGLFLVMISFITIPESDSSASGHLLTSIIGPAIMFGIGVFLAIFGGEVPVGRFPPFARKVGFLSVLIGIIWLILMHFWRPPIWRSDINPYWLSWWPLFLMMTIFLSTIMVQVLLYLGENRKKEAVLIGSFASLCLFLIGLLMLVDGKMSTSESFRGHLWLASADLVGTLLGIMTSALCFTLVIVLYERTLFDESKGSKLPKQVEELTVSEKERVEEIINSNIRSD